MNLFFLSRLQLIRSALNNPRQFDKAVLALVDGSSDLDTLVQARLTLLVAARHAWINFTDELLLTCEREHVTPFVLSMRRQCMPEPFERSKVDQRNSLRRLLELHDAPSPVIAAMGDFCDQIILLALIVDSLNLGVNYVPRGSNPFGRPARPKKTLGQFKIKVERLVEIKRHVQSANQLRSIPSTDLYAVGSISFRQQGKACQVPFFLSKHHIENAQLNATVWCPDEPYSDLTKPIILEFGLWKRNSKMPESFFEFDCLNQDFIESWRMSWGMFMATYTNEWLGKRLPPKADDYVPLEVPFADKSRATELGMLWDGGRRCEWVARQSDMTPFEDWIIEPKDSWQARGVRFDCPSS